MIWPLYINECVKIFSKLRTYIGFGAMALIIPLAIWGFSVGGSGIQRNLLGQLEGEFLTTGNLANGMWASYTLMFALFIHVPFLITLGAGDAVAGEGTAGTFRIYLTRPISRSRVLFSKLLASGTYSVALVFWLGLLSLGIGNIWLGAGDVFVLTGDEILILPFEVALGRFAIAYLLAAFMMLTVTALTFLFSVLVTNAVGPIVGTMAVLIVSTVLGVLNIDNLAWLQDNLFTAHFDVWQYAFYDPIPWDSIRSSLLNLGTYGAIFAVLSFYFFNRKDILT